MITLEDCKQAKEYNYKGLSTDEKPLDCYVNSLFLELDTGIFYFFNGAEWKDISQGITLGETTPTGTISITENGIFDVHDYAEADVDVPAITPTGTISITENGTYDVTNYAEASVDVDVTVNFNLPAFKKTTPTALSQARRSFAATTVGDYALFGGGYDGSSYSNVVDAYDSNLTRSTPTALSQASSGLAATTVGNYALFGGGSSSVVDAYDTSLTRTTPTALSQARGGLAATTVAPAGGSSPQSGYALFGGGFNNSVGYPTVVDAYDTTLTKTTPTDQLSTGRSNLAATTVGNYALFGGGYNSNAVDAYDINLTKTTPTDPLGGSNLGQLAATTVAPVGGSSPQSGYALFGGGVGSYNGAVYAYDTNLTRLTADPLGQTSYEIAATTVAPAGGSAPQSGYALFGGGTTTRTVYAYDTNLTKSTINDQLSVSRRSPAATTIGNYALFGGGYNGSSSYYNSVDAYNPFHDIQVFPGTKYSFNGSTEQTSSTWQTLTMQGEVIGYIKVKDATVN